MPVEISELDQLQAAYKATVEEWIAIIRQEEALASNTEHSVADIDSWEEAGDKEDEARARAKKSKKAYEDALREKFFNF